MKLRKNVLGAAISAVLLGLAGCGASTQDGGLGDSDAAAVSGVAVDGYVAFAVVYVDTNKNNKLDVWETRALTDSQGYFSYNPNKSENYCQSPGSDSYKYCLKIPAGYDEVLVRMTKGYDLSTSEPFSGTLSMMVRANASNLSTVQVGTPITSLLAEMTAAQKANFYANESDLAESFATLDFLDFSDSSTLSDEQRLVLLKLALRIHKIADAIAGRLDASLAQGSDSGFFGVKEGIPVDASTYVYRAIAEAITADLGITAILTDKAIMAGVISNAWAKMTTVVSDYNALQKDSKKYLIPAVDPDFTSIAADVDQLASAVATVFTDSLGADGSYSKSDDAKARIRAIDVIATLVRSNANPLGLSNAVSLLSDADYMANLKSPKVDMAGLKTKFKNATTATSVSADGANYDSRESFSNLLSANASAAGLTGADGGAVNDQGFAGNSMEINDKDASGNVENGTKVTFEGDTADATSGTMTIDATFASGDFAKKDENGDPEPLSLQGTWEQLDEYTMLMNVEVAGVVEPVIVKPTLTDDGKTAYYFDLGGEQQIWVP